MFAYTAKQSGKVISKNKFGVIVEYDDGTRKGVTLGRVFGKAEGSVYPHDIVSNLNVGDVIEKGTPIAYNTGFFEQDSLDPKNIVFKTSMTAKVALLESNQTHEDSSSISKSLSALLKSRTTKVKSVIVNFNENIINIVKPGQKVHTKDILMTIEDEITSTNSSFDEESLAVLKKLSNQSPKCGYEGTIDKIEVLYHGDKEDMSASLLAIVEQSDSYRNNIAKATGLPTCSGAVNDEYSVKRKPLTVDKAEIKIYITVENLSGTGDKVIFANQMKSVIGEVMDYDTHTESGEKIDAIFGYRSIAARIVLSPLMIGTTTTLLKIIGKQAVKLYRG